MTVAILLANQTLTTTPINSSLGMLIAILGATFVLAAMMLVEIKPS